jgi:hypothetical protein
MLTGFDAHRLCALAAKSWSPYSVVTASLGSFVRVGRVILLGGAVRSSDRRPVPLTGLGLVDAGAVLGLAPAVAAQAKPAPVIEKRPPGR